MKVVDNLCENIISNNNETILNTTNNTNWVWRILYKSKTKKKN